MKSAPVPRPQTIGLLSAMLLAVSIVGGCRPDDNGPDISGVTFEGEATHSNGLVISIPTEFNVTKEPDGFDLLQIDRRSPLSIHITLLRDFTHQPKTKVRLTEEAVGSGGAEYSFSSSKMVGKCLIFVSGQQQSEWTPSFIIARAVLEKASATDDAGC